MEENKKTCCSYPKCGCVGYAYVPVQDYDESYCPAEALMKGTLFPELDLNICEYGEVCRQWGGEK